MWTHLYSLKSNLQIGPTRKSTMPYEALKEHLENHKQYDYDPRFRGYNRSRECAWNYGDYFRCMRVLGDRGDDTTPCEWFKKQYSYQCQIRRRKRGTTSERPAFSGDEFTKLKFLSTVKNCFIYRGIVYFRCCIIYFRD